MNKITITYEGNYKFNPEAGQSIVSDSGREIVVNLGSADKLGTKQYIEMGKNPQVVGWEVETEKSNHTSLGLLSTRLITSFIKK